MLYVTNTINTVSGLTNDSQASVTSGFINIKVSDNDAFELEYPISRQRIGFPKQDYREVYRFAAWAAYSVALTSKWGVAS